MDTPPDTEHEKVGACWECGYSLRGLPTPRCPECGRPFNPADPLTMNMGVHVSPLAQWFMRPPGWPIHLLTAAAVIMSLWACVAPTRPNAFVDHLTRMYAFSSMPFGYSSVWDDLPWRTMFSVSNPLERFCIAGSLWLLIAAIWIVRRTARGITVKRLSQQRAATFAYWRRWLITPVIFGATIVICRTSLPTYAGFWCSRGKFNQAVLDAKSSGGWLPPRRLGFFDPYPAAGKSPQILSRDGETLVAVEYRAYFIYRDSGQPDPSWKPTTFKRLSSNWFWVTSGSQ